MGNLPREDLVVPERSHASAGQCSSDEERKKKERDQRTKPCRSGAGGVCHRTNASANARPDPELRTRALLLNAIISDDRTMVTVEMTYDAEGLKEALGSALGFDSRRVEGDLERFKEFIESRPAESGAWRGEVHQGP